MSKHTSPPWEVSNLDRHEQRTVTGANGRLVAVCAHECVTALVPEMEANARLIAAAPDMLEALEQIRDEIASPGHGSAHKIGAIARAAIAKTEGR